MTYLVEESESWNTAYSREYSALSDTNLFSDGDKTVDGKVWTLANSAVNGTDAGVGPTYGGLQTAVNASIAARVYQAQRTGIWFRTNLKQYLEGTDAEGRPDVEMRISARFGYTGSFSGTFNAICCGLGTTSGSGNFNHWILTGIQAYAMTYYSEVPGALRSGPNPYTTVSVPPLSYNPNCFQISLLEGYVRHYAIADDGALDLDAAVWSVAQSRLGTTAHIPSINLHSVAANQLHFFFGVNNYYGTGGVTAMALEEFRVEWRSASRGGVVVLC